MTEKDVDKLLVETGRCFTSATFLESIPLYCKGFKSTKFQSNEAYIAIGNFIQCSKKTLYFSRQALFSLKECFNEDYIGFFRNNLIPLTPNSNINRSRIPYAEEIIFNFDAFTFSAKTILEKHFVQSLKSLEGDSYEYVEKLYSLFLEQFLKPGLSTIRNEIVHHNFSGSTSDYTASIRKTDSGWDMSINSNFIIKGHKEPADLLMLLSELTDGIMIYINGILAVIVGSYYQAIGPPIKDQGFQWKNYNVKLSDFEVPNYDVNL